jgi:hypothetical protein
MNTKTTVLDADLEAADERLKAAVLCDLTPQELADRLLVARTDDPDYGLELALKDLLQASHRLARRKALNGRTADELSDDEHDKLPMDADPSIIVHALVDDYSVKAVCRWAKEWAKEVGEEDDDDE